MPDVDLSSGFDWGPVRTGMEEMRAFVSQTTRGISGDATGMFAGVISAGTIITEFKAVVESAHEIHHEAERFGVDAEQLQLIGNAAGEVGINLNTTARAMNQLTINAQAALNPTSKQAAALRDLGINAVEFARLNPQEQFLALADAYHSSAQDGAAYADVATLVGKRNTDMIPILAKGSTAIREQGEAMGIMSDKSVELLDKVYSQLQVVGNQAKVLGATVYTTLQGWEDAIERLAQRAHDVMVQTFSRGTSTGDLSKVVVLGQRGRTLQQMNKWLLLARI
jgi:hypothetical protein